MLDKICYAYWSLIPYDWRPSQLWYQFACWGWRRHTTVKSRYLHHTWCDKVDLIPHTIMEMLSDFIEKECSPGFVEWYGEYPKTINFRGREWNVRDLMQHIYDWYHLVYHAKMESLAERADKRWAFKEKNSTASTDEIMTWLEPVWNSENSRDEYNKLWRRDQKILESLEEQLDEYCHAVISMRRIMWT